MDAPTCLPLFQSSSRAPRCGGRHRRYGDRYTACRRVGAGDLKEPTSFALDASSGSPVPRCARLETDRLRVASCVVDMPADPPKVPAASRAATMTTAFLRCRAPPVFHDWDFHGQISSACVCLPAPLSPWRTSRMPVRLQGDRCHRWCSLKEKGCSQMTENYNLALVSRRHQGSGPPWRTHRGSCASHGERAGGSKAPSVRNRDRCRLTIKFSP